jgi:hypothetical protein
MRAYGRSGGILPFILITGNSSRWAVSFKLRPIYSPGTIPLYPDQVWGLGCQGQRLGHVRNPATNLRLSGPQCVMIEISQLQRSEGFRINFWGRVISVGQNLYHSRENAISNMVVHLDWTCKEYKLLNSLMFCFPCIIVDQYNETNVMHVLFNLLRINASTCFEHYLHILRRRLHERHLVYCMRVMSVGCTRIEVPLPSWCSQLT